MAKFSIGEVALLYNVHPSHPVSNGTEVTVLSAPYVLSGIFGYDVEVPGYPHPRLNGHWHAGEANLVKKRPPEDRQVVNWKDCVWQPKMTKENGNV